MKRSVSTVIIKPTKGCNADCSYCSAPPDGYVKWNFDKFKFVFDQIEARLHPAATLIWHGGEPMLLGPSFYRQSFDYAVSKLPNVKFSMQTNLLSYNNEWNSVFRSVFKGSVSTSWDPDELCRTVKGKPELFARIFDKRLQQALSDGWYPKVISTFTDDSIHLAHHAYDRAMASSLNAKPYDVRLNYRYPAGRASEEGAALNPIQYGQTLVEIFDRWISDAPEFDVTPLDQMLKQVIGAENARCPWSKGCTGKIIGIEPNLDVYNCGEFADTQDPQYRFGNLHNTTLDQCLTSVAAISLSKRAHLHPASCTKCIHYAECEGGCMRDSVLFGRGLYGKFFYCESWQKTFSHIKQRIIEGAVDPLLIRRGIEPHSIKLKVKYEAAKGLSDGKINWIPAGDFQQ